MKIRIQKPYQMFVLLSAFVVGLTLLASAGIAAPIATLDQIQGEVMVQASGASADQWSPATQGQELNSGDSVKTQNGSCAVLYADQATVTVQPNTVIVVKEQNATQDIELKLGKLKAKVNKEKVIKPFQVITPTAVSAVRGTEVDFDFNEEGKLTIDLHDGNLHVYNEEAGMSMDLGGGKKIDIFYDAESGILKVKNDCSSSGAVSFSVLGTEYAENPCEEKEINLETAEGQTGIPDTTTGNDGENEPNEDGNPDLPQDISPTE